MGVLEDIGLKSQGQLSKSFFSGFVSDLKKRLTTGKGIFKSPVISQQVDSDPIKNFDLAKIENQFLFPEFHRIWKERLNKTVNQLDLPGAFAAGVPTGIIDPSALAKQLGAKNSGNPKFPDILFEVQGLNPPGSLSQEPPATIKDVLDQNLVKTAEFFNKHLKGLNHLDPKTIEKLVTTISTPPVGIKPESPDPRLLKYGYAQQSTFEKQIYLAQRKAHVALLIKAAGDPSFIPNLIVQMSSGQNDLILKEVYDMCAKFQPTPMTTSAFEIAAQEILLQHQVKMQCIALLAQNIGSGDIVKALSATPEEQGGLGLADLSKTANEQVSGSEKTSAEIGQTGGAGGGSTTTESTTTLSGESPTQAGAGSGGGGVGDTSNQPSNPFDNTVSDEPPQGSSAQGGTTPSVFGGQPADEYPPPAGANEGGPAQQPSGFAFGGVTPADEIPPGGSDGQGNISGGQQGTGGNQGQNTPFGFDAPADEAPPPGTSGGTGGQSTPSPFSGPPADEYPPNSPEGQGQTAPPGFGGAPTDEGSEPQQQPAVPQIQEEEGEIMGVETPTAPAKQDQTPASDPPDYPASDTYVPPGGTTHASSYPGDDDDDMGTDGPGDAKKTGKKATSVRSRIKDLIEGGGPTCELGALGPARNWASEGFRSFELVGATAGGTDDPRWSQPIPGAYGVSIGGSFTSANLINIATNQKDESNTTQSIPTSCGHMPGYVLRSIVHGPGDQPWSYEYTSDDKQRGTAALGFDPGGVGIDDKNNRIVNLGTGDFAYGFMNNFWVCAMIGAFVKVIGNPSAPPPKYGDLYCTINSDGNIAHVGVVIEWHPEEGWWVNADAGQGGMSASPPSQGMCYRKAPLKTDSKGNYLVTSESQQADPSKKRIFYGYIDVDILMQALRIDERFKGRSPQPPWSQG